MMTLVNRGEQSSNDLGDLVSDGHDLTKLFMRYGQDNVESWRESGLEGERTYFYGTFPATASAVINLGEVVVHSWDLAKATSQLGTLNPDMAGLIYDLYSFVPLDGMRAAGQLGSAVDVPADAPVADRMLGLLGRHP